MTETGDTEFTLVPSNPDRATIRAMVEHVSPLDARAVAQSFRLLADQVEAEATLAERAALPPSLAPERVDGRDEWLTRQQVADLLGVTGQFVKSKLYHLGHKLGHKTVRYKKSEVEKWATRRRPP